MSATETISFSEQPWMVPAFLMEGKQFFENEDPKYLAFLKGLLQPPPGGWPEGW